VENVFTEFDIIHISHIHIGGYVELPDDQLPLINVRLPKFIGSIQRIVFNGIDFIEMSQTSYLHKGRYSDRYAFFCPMYNLYF